MNVKSIIFSLLVVSALAITAFPAGNPPARATTSLPADNPPVMAGVVGGPYFQVELLSGHPQNNYGNNTQTWGCKVTVLADQGALSHWALDLCDNPAHVVTSSSPSADGFSNEHHWPGHGNLIKWEYSLDLGGIAQPQ